MCRERRRSHHEEGGHHHAQAHSHGHTHGHGHAHRGGRGGERGHGHGPHHEHHGGPGGRARRGEAKHLVLDALRDGPKHGYEIIKWLQERSSGQYVPSPGTVYPTLQFLEDLGQVRADQEAERRVYHLTEAGQTEWQARAEEIAAFWARLQGPEASAAGQAEVGFLREELENLAQTVEIGIRTALERSDTDALRGIRQTIETCRNEIRRQIAGQGGSETSNS